MTAAPATTAAEQVRLLHVIWIAFFLAVGLYTPVPLLLVRDSLDSAAPLQAGARSGLHFAALGAAVSSFFARRWWTNSLLASLRSATAAPVSTDAWARLRAGCLITWGLSESVVLLGLASAVVTRRPADVLPLAAAAAVLLYLHRPAAWPVQALTRAAGEAE